jgi:DNA modification methylase
MGGSLSKFQDEQPQLITEHIPVVKSDPAKQRIREEYRAKLAEKLKDPEFRKIEGFPIGTDEAILALSDPPYYTACPNPFIEEWLKEHCKPFDPDTDDYHREPFATDVSEGRADPLYTAHTYHTKVPHKAILRYILHYTKPGDVVFDGFCGTGMTGVAARLCGDKKIIQSLGYSVNETGQIDLEAGHKSEVGTRSAILSDLSPVATFISSLYNFHGSLSGLASYAQGIINLFNRDYGWLYTHLDSCSDADWSELRRLIAGCSNTLTLRNLIEEIKLPAIERSSPPLKNLMSVSAMKCTGAVWSEVFRCPACSQEIVMWEFAQGEKTEDKSFACSGCSTLVARSPSKKSSAAKLERSFSSQFDSILGEVTKTPTLKLVHANVKTGKNRATKVSQNYSQAFTELLAEMALKTSSADVPVLKFPEGRQTNKLINGSGVTYLHQMYTPRALAAYAILWKLVDNDESSHPLAKYCLTAINNYISRKQGYFGGGGGVAGTMYAPTIHAERSVIDTFARKTKQLARTSFPHLSNTLVNTSSVGDLSTIPAASVDYIFTDPPFGESLQYAELNFYVEGWLGVTTSWQDDCVLNYVHKKGIEFYSELMASAFRNYSRLLKPGRWITVEFHNSQNTVWTAIQNALERAGFIVASVRVLDKQQRSYNAINRSGAVDQDLVISAYKPSAKFVTLFTESAGTLRSVCEFVREHLQHLPMPGVASEGKIEHVVERNRFLLFDRMVAYHLKNSARVPMSAAQFYELIDAEFFERDEMFFLTEQAARYDVLKSKGLEVAQLSIFVTDEKTAIQWIRSELTSGPQTLGELTHKFLLSLQDWGLHEVIPELRDLLQQYFIREEDENWVVPDPDNERHLEEVRRKAMLREFQEYIRRPGQLKLFRTEAVLAGFLHCWETKQYDVIVGVCEKIPAKILQAIQDLVMYYDLAKDRTPEKVAQFEFKWEQ